MRGSDGDGVGIADQHMTGGPCRFCGEELTRIVTDLGMSPPCQSFLEREELDSMETFYPLVVWVCDRCWLMQLREYVGPADIFEEYAYFSSFSDSWVDHMHRYADAMIERFDLGPGSLVVEVASNDGYLLQWFQSAGVPVLGIEPAKNIASVAQAKGIETITEFFGRELGARLKHEGRGADLVCGANVMAQVPDLNSFVEGFANVLNPGGVVTVEFPHLQRLIEQNQFDTIYHEHFSYFSLHTTEQIFAAHGLTIFDVDELSTHGGSLRIYARHADDDTKPISAAVIALRAREIDLGYASPRPYERFDAQVKQTKRRLLEFLIHVRDEGKTVIGYGAAGKGMTLLNFCGIRTDFMDMVVDRNPYKHGRFCPGVHVPVLPVEALWSAKPDYVMILPWNLRDEISAQLEGIREWGGKFVVPIPAVEVW